MKHDKTFLGIIAARGGSKGLPGKNIRPLGGKPLIAWTIEAALQSACLDDVLVTTDCPEIAAAAMRYGASVPFLRPAELANDTAPQALSFVHALDFYRRQGKTFDYLVAMQPTSPLRTGADIAAAIEFLFEKNADAVISVCEMEHSPVWANTLPEDCSMENFVPDYARDKQRQELPIYYRINGALYIVSVEKFLEGPSVFLKKNIFAYIMPQERSVDIDCERDLLLAEILLQQDQKPC